MHHRSNSVASLQSANSSSADDDAVHPISISKQLILATTSNRHDRNHHGRATHEGGISYHILKFPLLFFISIVILLELIGYMLTRFYVLVHEWLFAHRPPQLPKEILDMPSEKWYEEWQRVAALRDSRDASIAKWKAEDSSEWFDWTLIRGLTMQLQKYTRKLEHLLQNPPSNASSPSASSHVSAVAAGLKNKKPKKKHFNAYMLKIRKVRDKLKHVVELSTKPNLGGIENENLYSRCHVGTKNLIQTFYDSTRDAIQILHKSRAISVQKQMSELETPASWHEFIESCQSTYGRSSLCLSGGASFGYYHLGVIRAMFEQGTLPQVITGTSAGSLIAAYICCRTDQELHQTLNPSIYRVFTACSTPWLDRLKNLYKEGAMFSPDDWTPKVKRDITFGDMTFREAYQRTGRILNISIVSAESRHLPSKLCNYHTMPDVVIWSAVLASAAVPYLLPPIQLQRKVYLSPTTITTTQSTRGSLDETSALSGAQYKLVPYVSEGAKWQDGSVRIDIPIQQLHRYFNVSFNMVSQVNPHIILFFFEHRGSTGQPTKYRSGRGWRGGFIASSLEHALKLDLLKNLRILRDLDLLPRLPVRRLQSVQDAVASVFLQKFEGNVTVVPRASLRDYWYILTDPDEQRMRSYFERGAVQTFPKMSLVQNRMALERLLCELS